MHAEAGKWRERLPGCHPLAPPPHVQSLLATPLLMRYFTTGMWRYDLNTKAALGSGGFFALAFADQARTGEEEGGCGLLSLRLHTAESLRACAPSDTPSLVRVPQAYTCPL